MSSAIVLPDKIAAYRATAYCVEAIEPPFVLRIGEPSKALQCLYASTGTWCGLFITAFNPYGRRREEAANQSAHRVLGRRLAALTLHVFDGAGRDTLGEWPAEKSFLALGINGDIAAQLGKEFGQDAIVWCGVDAVPELVLLR